MMNPPGTSSFPGYYSTVPPRPPDIHDFGNIDVKGEYIEDCDDIKEETEDRQTPAPAPPVSFIPSQYSPYRGVSVSQGCPPMMPRMPPLTPSTFQPNLTPLQLIQKLSNYAANNSRKRVSTMSPMQTEITSQTSQSHLCPPAKKFQTTFHHQNQNVSFQPKIDKVMSLQSSQGQPKVVSPPKQKETNNNSNSSNKEKVDSPPDVPDMTGQSTKSMIDCPVCGDIAVAHFHYGGMCCYSCKAFFRRVVNTNKVRQKCNFFPIIYATLAIRILILHFFKFYN